MLVLAVTHCDAASRNPRALSEGGRQQALLAARRLRELVGRHAVLARVISSPKARCLETAIAVARELGETTIKDGTYHGHIEVAPELDEVAAGPHTETDLRAILDRLPHCDSDSAVLLAAHGDLATMLTGSVRIAPGFIVNGFFGTRPVVAVLDYEEGRVRAKHCEAFNAGRWVSCAAIDGES